jgi:superfamily I DNA and/or RNA helicase
VLQVPGAFDPDFLVCDESGQCLEGDHMIAMTMPSIKAVILIGDQEQLPPTVVTEHSNNEGAEYLKRSLMERLCSAGYPTTMLSINYRCLRR